MKTGILSAGRPGDKTLRILLKAKNNLLKHQVAFEEASSIFDDLQFITFLDDEHSINEERYMTHLQKGLPSIFIRRKWEKVGIKLLGKLLLSHKITGKDIKVGENYLQFLKIK